MTVPSRVHNWAKHRSALVALTETLRVLELHRIPVVVVKGMVLAYSLYEDVADRPLGDVDLRIRPVDFVRTVRAMSAQGFGASWASRQFGAASFHVGRELVEFETSVGPPGLCALTASRLLARSTERTLPSGLRLREPEIYDHAVLLLVNAYKDKMIGSPSWSLDDMDTIVGRVDLGVLCARIANAKIRTLSWVVADWMARERGSPRCRALRDRIGAEPPRLLYGRTMRRLFARRRSSFGLRTLTRMASDSPTRRLWALSAGAAGTVVSWIGMRG